MRAAPPRAASTSSRTARSPAIRRDADGARRRRRDDARLHQAQEGRRRRGRPYHAWSWTWPASACRSKATRCRRWSRSRSSRCSPAWSCRTPCTPTSASPTRASWSSAPAPTSTSPTASAAACHIIEHTLDAICELFPIFTPHAHAAQLGRHRRRHARPLADHRQDAGAGPLRQLRLGHRRLQGDAGLGPRLRPHHRQRRAAPDQRALHAGALPHRPADRRGGAAAVAH